MLASFWGSSLIVIYSSIETETKKETNKVRTHNHHGWHSKKTGRSPYDAHLD